MEVKVKKLHSAAILPRRGSAQAAGYDLFACLPEEGEIVLQPGENMVPLHNDSGVPQTIRHGDRVAQMVVLPYLAVDFLEADALDETERGEGGFGSTGR